MTRRHFESLAQALKFERPGHNWDPNKHLQWNADVKAVARACKSANERFDEQKFFYACGGLT